MPLQPRLALCGAVSKDDVEQLLATVVSAAKTSRRIVIDCTRVASLDLEAISSLCGVHRHLTRRGCLLVVEGLTTRHLDQAIGGSHGFAPWTVCSIKHETACLWARQ